jgi:mannose-6-phosphate isomerase
MEIYPMRPRPRFDERIWGGHGLAQELGKDAPADRLVGESWEVHDDNSIENGPYAGETIGALRDLMGSDLMGHVPPENSFPLLTKLIDAADVLSVQVHPDDYFARKLEHQPNGKTECWYVLSAKPGSTLTCGFSRDTSPEEYVSLVQSGRLQEVLRQFPVQAGDVVYIPAGTVHAIGAGIMVFELQQTSDVTYRMYDWDRRDASGKPRELHVDRARQVLHYGRATDRGTIRPLQEPDGSGAVLVAGPHFVLELVQLSGEREVNTHDSPVVLCALEDGAVVRAGEMTVTLEPYSSAVVPAAAGTLSLEANTDDGGRCLVAYVPISVEATRSDLLGRGFSPDEVDGFLGQFIEHPHGEEPPR